MSLKVPVCDHVSKCPIITKIPCKRAGELIVNKLSFYLRSTDFSYQIRRRSKLGGRLDILDPRNDKECTDSFLDLFRCKRSLCLLGNGTINVIDLICERILACERLEVEIAADLEDDVTCPLLIIGKCILDNPGLQR